MRHTKCMRGIPKNENATMLPYCQDIEKQKVQNTVKTMGTAYIRRTENNSDNQGVLFS